MALSRRHVRRLQEAIRVVLIVLVALVMMVPIVWIILAAFKQHVDVYQLRRSTTTRRTSSSPDSLARRR